MKKIIALITASIIASQIGVAYASDFPVFLTEMSFGSTVLEHGVQSFDNNEMYEWSGVDETVLSSEFADENSYALAQGANATVNSDMGRELFLAAAPKGTLYWDFEDSVTFTDDNHGVDAIDAKGEKTGDFIDKIAYGEDVASPDDDATEVLGKWTGVNYNPTSTQWRMNPVYTPISSVLTYNNIVRLGGTLTGSGVAYGVPADADPAAGSNQVCAIRTDNQSGGATPRMLGMRVKLSKDMIEVGKEYNLSYHIANNGITGSHTGKNMMMFAIFQPFDENQNIPVTTNGTNDVKWVNFTKYLATTDGKTGVQRYWQRVETKLMLDEADFNEDGYTTLWLLASGWINSVTAQPSQVYNPPAGEYVYFDNIALSPCEVEEKDNTFDLSLDVKGDIGDNIEMSLILDNERELIKKSINLANEGWNTISASFSMSADDEYIIGKNHGDTKKCNDSRVKLKIKTSGNSMAIDNVSFSKPVIDNFEKYYGEKLTVNGVLYNADENISEAELRLSVKDSYDEHLAEPARFGLKKGLNIISTQIELPESEYINSNGFIQYKITNQSGSSLCENVGFNRFFANGVNVIPSVSEELSNVIESFGTGLYLAEFSISGVNGNVPVSISYGGAVTSLSVSEDGTYQAELEIDKIENGKELVIEAQTGEVNGVTLKKVLDY